MRLYWEKRMKMKQINRGHENNCTSKTGERFVRCLRGIKTVAAAGIVLAALGILPCSETGALFSGQDGGALRAKAAESSGEEVFGRLDTFTGERISEEQSDSQTTQISQKIWITDNMFYEPEKKAYGYYAGEEIVYANVADGMIVKEKVSVKVPETVKAKIYWEGRSMDFTGGNISRLGSYTVEVAVDATTIQLFSFTIVNSDTNAVLNYNMPEGFRITKATLDGTEIDYTRKFVDMSKEGHYIISYECSKSGVPYTLDVTVDMTPPTVVLEGLDEDGKARGPVAITQKLERDTMVITRNGEEYKAMLSNVLTQSGRYIVTITDPAGNSTEYRFTIMIYLDKNAWIFSALFLVVVIAVTATFIYFKKHLRVR